MSTFLGFVKPAFNAFFLMTLGVPSVVLLSYNLRQEESFRVTSLGWRCVALWVSAVTCWLNDRYAKYGLQ